MLQDWTTSVAYPCARTESIVIAKVRALQTHVGFQVRVGGRNKCFSFLSCVHCGVGAREEGEGNYYWLSFCVEPRNGDGDIWLILWDSSKGVTWIVLIILGSCQLVCVSADMCVNLPDVYWCVLTCVSWTLCVELLRHLTYVLCVCL